jgi:hypothetical protein
LTISYKLFGWPRTLPEYFGKVCKEGRGSSRILISYETHQSLTQPRANVSPFMNYEIWLVLFASTKGDSMDKIAHKEDPTLTQIESNTKMRGRTFKILLTTGTKTQFADTDPLAQETQEAVQHKLPEILDLCKKYGVNYRFDEKTTKLLMGHP